MPDSGLPNENLISYSDFAKVDMRIGKIIECEDFPGARKPSYKLKIDFGGEIGIRRSSAQITKRYKKEELQGKLIVAVVNFPPKQIANFNSEVLVLGVEDKDGSIILLKPETKEEVVLGSKVY